MKKYRAYLIALLAALIASTLLIGLNTSSSEKAIEYPELPLSTHAQPQVIAQIDRDFAYRTGDPITFTLFVNQVPGTVIDAESFAVGDTNDGDIDFTSNLVGIKSLADGSKLLAVQVTLHKWSYEQTFTVDATISYIVADSGDTNVLPVTGMTVYMSPTWDGRKTLNQGDSPEVKDADSLLNIILVVVGAGIGVAAALYMRRLRRENLAERALKVPVLTKLELLRERYELVRDLIEGRDFRLAHYAELERIVRDLFDIETLSTDKVVDRLGKVRSFAHEDVMTILTECDKRLYRRLNLSESEHAAVFAAFEHLFEEIPKHEEAPTQKRKRFARKKEVRTHA